MLLYLGCLTQAFYQWDNLPKTTMCSWTELYPFTLLTQEMVLLYTEWKGPVTPSSAGPAPHPLAGQHPILWRASTPSSAGPALPGAKHPILCRASTPSSAGPAPHTLPGQHPILCRARPGQHPILLPGQLGHHYVLCCVSIFYIDKMVIWRYRFYLQMAGIILIPKLYWKHSCMESQISYWNHRQFGVQLILLEMQGRTSIVLYEIIIILISDQHHAVTIIATAWNNCVKRHPYCCPYYNCSAHAVLSNRRPSSIIDLYSHLEWPFWQACASHSSRMNNTLMCPLNVDDDRSANRYGIG